MVVVVAQLAKRLLPSHECCGSIPVIGKHVISLAFEKKRRKVIKKWPGTAHFKNPWCRIALKENPQKKMLCFKNSMRRKRKTTHRVILVVGVRATKCFSNFVCLLLATLWHLRKINLWSMVLRPFCHLLKSRMTFALPTGLGNILCSEGHLNHVQKKMFWATMNIEKNLTVMTLNMPA